MAALDLDNNEDEIYSLFESKSNFNLQDNESYRKLLQSAQGNRPNSSRNIPLRIATSTGFGQGMSVRPGSSFRPITSFRPGSTFRADSSYRSVTGRPGTGNAEVNRPMTAVRGAGYTSHGRKMFDPLNQAAQIAQQSEENKEETPEEKIHQLENKIMQCIEQAIVSSCERKVREGLDKAKDASSKERNLIRLQEQAGLSDSHNLDLTFAVLFNLAVQYTKNEMYSEAINTYQLITRNRMFANSHRLKVNMGNIYYVQGHVHKAVKLWRMALDQAPASHARLRMRIMHNIGVAHVRTGRYSDAVGVLEYILGEGRNVVQGVKGLHRAALHLVLCHYALEDVPRMRHAFRQMLDVPLVIDDEDKYRVTSDDPEEALIADAIRNDELHKYEQAMRRDAEYCILTAAKLIAPVIEDTFSLGYEWCVQSIKNSRFAHLAGDLEINKAVMFLKQSQISEAIDTLKIFEKESKIATSAATNLSFIYFLQGDLDNAEKYGEIVKSTDAYNANGYVNLGVCALSRGDLTKSRQLFEQAMDCDPSHAEALYNLGLTYLRQGACDEALSCFRRLSGGLSLLPEVLWQTGECLRKGQDNEAAAECLQQLLGLTPTDPGVLAQLASVYDREGDKQQAYHYYHDAYRHYPSDLSVCNWLGGYHVELQTGERALWYFERASLIQPGTVRWRLLSAGCRRRAGDPHSALATLERARRDFPDSPELLRTLTQLYTELGRHDEATQHQHELRRLERARDVRDRLTSATGSRRSAGSSVGSARSAASPAHERRASSRLLAQVRDSQDSNEESTYTHSIVDASYADPLGPLATRPRTSGLRNMDEDFGDEQIGDDLLPE